MKIDVAFQEKSGTMYLVMELPPSSKITAPPMPSDWKVGLEKGRYRIACGGKEIPVYHPVRGWMVLVFDQKMGRHLYYFYKSDTFSDSV